MNENRPCDIAALLRDTERYVVESVWSRATNEQAAVVSTSRLHNIAGKYTGKDDPVMLIRVQMDFPATGEVLTPFAAAHFVAGGKRGSHQMPLMPVPRNTPTNYFDGPPRVTCAAYSMHAGKLSGPQDCFAHPFWDHLRDQAAAKAIEMRRQGFFRCRNAADVETRIHRHHATSRGAGRTLPAALITLGRLGRRGRDGAGTARPSVVLAGANHVRPAAVPPPRNFVAAARALSGSRQRLH